MSRIPKKFVFQASVSAATAQIASQTGAATAQITAQIAVTAVVIAGTAKPTPINQAVNHSIAVVPSKIHFTSSGFAFVNSVNQVITGCIASNSCQNTGFNWSPTATFIFIISASVFATIQEYSFVAFAASPT